MGSKQAPQPLTLSQQVLYALLTGGEAAFKALHQTLDSPYLPVELCLDGLAEQEVAGQLIALGGMVGNSTPLTSNLNDAGRALVARINGSILDPQQNVLFSDHLHLMEALRDEFQARHLLHITAVISQGLSQNKLTPRQAQDQLEMVRRDLASQGAVWVSPLAADYAARGRVTVRERLEKGVQAFTTGFAPFDALRVFVEGQITALIAPPKVGKTALAHAIADTVACTIHRSGVEGCVLFVTLELTGDMIMTRIAAARARVNPTAIVQGTIALNDPAYVAWDAAMSEIENGLPLVVLEGQHLGKPTMSQIAAQIDKYARQFGKVTLVCIDSVRFLAADREAHGTTERRQAVMLELAAGFVGYKNPDQTSPACLLVMEVNRSKQAAYGDGEEMTSLVPVLKNIAYAGEFEIAVGIGMTNPHDPANEFHPQLRRIIQEDRNGVPFAPGEMLLNFIVSRYGHTGFIPGMYFEVGCTRWTDVAPYQFGGMH